MERKKPHIRWGHFIVALLFIIGVPALFDRGSGAAKWSFRTYSSDRHDFDNSHIERLRQEQPETVFIGNSMLESRIEPGILNDLAPGKKHFLLSRHGTGSTVWYLFLKYHLIPSEVHPERVFIFFRDAELTNPDVEALCTWAIGQWVHLLPCEDQPFDRIFGGRPIGWDEHLDAFIKRVYPVRFRQEEIDIYLRRISSKGWVKPPKEMSMDEAMDFRQRETWKIQQEVNELYGLENLRSQKNETVYDPNADPTLYDFDYRLPRSFLPEIISLAKENDIDLYFIRNKKRPDERTGVTFQSQELITYISKLREYLARQGCKYHDFTDDPEIEISWYANEDHLKRNARNDYTRKFFNTFPEAFR